jgi:hypothetical protein
MFSTQPTTTPEQDERTRKAALVREIANRFTYHAPSGTQAARYEQIRHMAGLFAQELVKLAPESRELSTALTKLDEVVFWTNAAIARRESQE